MSWASWEAQGRTGRSRHEGKSRSYAYSQDDTSSSTWGRQQWYNDEDPSTTRGGQQRLRRRHNEDKVASSMWGSQAWARYHRPEEKISSYTWSEDDAETRSGNSRGSRALSPEASASWASDDDERHGSESVAKKSQMDGRACGQALLNMVKKSDRRKSPAEESKGSARAPHGASREAPKTESAPAAVPSSSAASAPSASAALRQLVRSQPPSTQMAAPSASAALSRLIGANAQSPDCMSSAVPPAPAAPPLTSPSTSAGFLATASSASTMPAAMESPTSRSEPRASAASAEMLRQAPAPVPETPAMLGASQQGSTKLRSSASMFVPGQSSPSAGPSHKPAPRMTGGQVNTNGRAMLHNAISSTFGTEIWNVMMVDCEDYTGRSYTAVEVTLPMCTPWPAGQLQQDQAALQNLQWKLSSIEGVQSAELSADGTALQMEYCLAGKDRLCWDFAHTGFCPRPACRWQHAAMEYFVITVLLRPSQVQKPLPPQPQCANLAGNAVCVIVQQNGQPAGQMAMQPFYQMVPQQVGKAIVMIQQPVAQQPAMQPLPSAEMTLVAEHQPFVQQIPLAPMQAVQRLPTSSGLPMQLVNGAKHQELNVDDSEETPWPDCVAPKHEGPAFFDNDAEDVNGASDSAKRVSWADLEDEDGEEIDLKQWTAPQFQ